MATIIQFATARQRVAPAGHDRASTVAAFLIDQQSAERSARTIAGHRDELRRFGAWLDQQQIDWQLATPADLSAYARTRAHRGPSSRASLVISLRVFYGWAVAQQLITRSPAAALVTPRRHKSAPRALASEQIALLLEHIDQLVELDPSARAARDRALVLTGLYTGFRAAELAALRWSDIDLAGQTATIIEGKGARGRTVRLHVELVSVLGTWRDQQQLAPDAPVFALSGEPIIANRVGKIVRQLARATGLPLTAHVLRHTFATMALRRSRHLYSVSRAMGHQHISTTMIYLRRDASDTDAAVDALPGRDGW